MTVILYVWQREFADVVKDFEMGFLAWIIQVASKCNHKCPYQKEAAGDLTPQEEKAMP